MFFGLVLKTTPASSIAGRIKSRNPSVSPLRAAALLPFMTLMAFGAGWVVASSQNPWWIGGALGVTIVLVATCLVTIFLLGRSIAASFAKSLAPLFMVRYGENERQRTQELLYSIATKSLTTPEFRVGDGELLELEPANPQKEHANEEKAKSKEIFMRTRQGPATLWVDRTSAVLVERGKDPKKNDKRIGADKPWVEGEYVVASYGKLELANEDRVLGMADLRPQKELFEISGALTKDIVPVDVKLVVIYQIIQDKKSLEQTQTHKTDVATLRRALLPNNDWRTKTRAQIKSQVNAVLCECDLWEIFAPVHPPDPIVIAEIYTLGHGIMPTPRRLTLEDRVQARINERCCNWGVHVTQVLIEQVLPPQDVRQSSQRAYVSWSKLTEQVLEAQKKAQADLKLAQVAREESRVKKEITVLDAEGKAKAYETEMRARAESALEFARKIDILRASMGEHLDEGAMRELLRALGFMSQEKEEEADPKWLRELVMRQRPRDL